LPHIPIKPDVLRKRAQFLAAASSNQRWVTPGVIVQLNKSSGFGYGLTATRKIGNAVKRNRARRRLRALVLEILPYHAASHYDYVLIARATTATRPYDELRKDLVAALKKLGVWRDK
jgi:ribonuclease P protein component